MNIRKVGCGFLLAGMVGLGGSLQGAVREKDWAQVEVALANRQPKTALGLLKPLETAAFANRAWGEGTKALLMRVRMENGLGFPESPFPPSKKPAEAQAEPVDPFNDPTVDPFADSPPDEETEDFAGLPGCVRQLEGEIATAPAVARPVLRWFQARWLLAYAEERSHQYDSRSKIAARPDDAIEAWDPSRLTAEIEKRFVQALADEKILRATPVAKFRDVLAPRGTLGDKLRPTLYDLVAHSLLEFLTDSPLGDGAISATFQIPADSPAFDGAEAFLAWQPATADLRQPKFRALQLFQAMLAFHRADKDPTAFLHCDLERLRWAGRFATGTTKPERQFAAIHAFITANAAHPLSADARQDEVLLLRMKNRLEEAHASAQAGAAAFPRHPFGKVCRGLVKEMEARGLEVATPSAWPASGDEITIRQTNLEHLWFRLYRRDWQPGEAMIEADPKMPEGKALAKLLKTSPAQAWDLPLADAPDLRSHGQKVATPTELTPGDYLLVVSDRADFSGKSALAWTSVSVSNIRLGLDSTVGGPGGVVVDAVTGAPLANVKVEIWQKPDKAAAERKETRTDADGVFAIELPRISGFGRVLVVATDGNHRAIARPWATRGSSYVGLKLPECVFFFTDRAIYRPGQTIHFKGIVFSVDQEHDDYHTVSDRAVTVTLTGPNLEAVGKVEATSNACGSFSGAFTAPSGSLLGEFEIAAGKLGRSSIRVEEYKRPKFTVEILPPEAPVVLGQPATVKGIARTYAGAPVDGASVEWEVWRGAYFTGLGALLTWNQNCFGPVRLATGKAVTGTDGSFAMTFAADPDSYLEPDMEPVFEYEIRATVTDPSGESHDERRTVFGGGTDFNAKVSAGEWQEEGKPVEIEVHTQTHDGEGFPAAGTLRVHALKSPAVCPRDDEMIPDSSAMLLGPGAGPAGWKLGEVLCEIAVSTVLDPKSGNCLAKMPVKLPAGAYRVMFEARDSKQRKVVAVTGLQVIQPAADHFPIKIPFYVGSPVWTREPGQPLTLVWGSGYETARACVEWYRDETLLKREWSVPGRTQQEFSITPDESLRGGFDVRVQQFSMNRHFSASHRIAVPWSNKALTLKWEHLTSKLQPGVNDTWTAVVTGPGGAAVPAEMVATLYDAALDDFCEHSFPNFSHLFRAAERSVYGSSYSGTFTWETGWSGGATYEEIHIQHPFRMLLDALDEGDRTSWIGVDHTRGRVLVRQSGYDTTLLDAEVYKFDDPPELPNSVGVGGIGGCGGFPVTPATSSSPPPPEDIRLEAERKKLAAVVSRRKLQETAFFYPHLTSDADGKIRISFTMPEGLGKWRFLGFAHDAAMRSGSLEGETVTAKDLMVQPNPPRFLRESDVLDFSVRITNQSDQDQRGVARFTLADAATDRDQTAALGITTPEQSFQIPAKQSRTLAWRLTVPDGTGFLRYKAVASCGNLSDGEEAWLPVLPRRVLVTDSMALSIRDAGTKNHTFEGLRDSGKSATLQHQSLQVQVVSQPAWYAVMALPYLMEFPHECAEQTFNRYYANALGRHVVTADPRMRRVFEQWRNTPALDSPLTKNQDLKGILLEETPWLQDATDESQSRRRVGMLFEDANLANELRAALEKLIGMQAKSGLWPWFPGGPESEYISLHIVAGFGHLRAMGVDTDLAPALKALGELDNILTGNYQRIQKAAKKDPKVLAQNHLDPLLAHHLYSRSFFLKDQALEDDALAAHEYFLGQAKQYWPKLQSHMAAAQVALALSRSGDATTAKLITRAFRETAVNRPETGMTWPAVAGAGWWWWQAPVETQAMMIQAFAEIDHDAKAVADCRVALIQQQRGREWPSTVATAAAVHALLAGPPGDRALSSDALVKVSLGGAAVEPGMVEPGTGYYEHRIPGAAVKPGMAEVSLAKTEAGIGWASVYWQYFEDVGKLAAHESGGMKLEKSLFVRRHTPQGPQLEPVTGPVRVGDELVTRLVVRNNQEMEFVHLKDARGSGTEPVNVLSGYRWQDGLGFYEVTRDAATHLFFDRLQVGTHVFEIPTRIQHAGVYQSGAAEIRCMYAPEFQARSGSTRLEVRPMAADGK